MQLSDGQRNNRKRYRGHGEILDYYYGEGSKALTGDTALGPSSLSGLGAGHES